MREQSTDLTEIFKAYKRRYWLNLYLADDTTLNLSRGAVNRKSVTYDNWIASVENLNSSIDTAVDRITINCQNVNSLLGFNLASNLRLLDYALGEYGKIYQSVRNPSLIVDLDEFRCVLANAEVDEQRISFELIVDYDSLGLVVASRNLSPRCWWTYKNGIECTSTAIYLDCGKTRLDCKKRGKPWEFGGWEFFEEPTSDLPGAGGNDNDGIGYPNTTCFPSATKIWTPRGDIPLGDLPLGKPKQTIHAVSFDSRTGEIEMNDEIEEVSEHVVTGHYTFEFEHGIIEPTPEHPFFVGLSKFVRADEFNRTDTTKGFIKDWIDTELLRIKWNSDKQTVVRNVRMKKNRTYFAIGENGRSAKRFPFAVHNKPFDPYQA